MLVRVDLMNRRRIGLCFALSGSLAWACSLNPQPYPPETADGSFADVVLAPNDAAGGIDGASGNDADGSSKLDGSSDATEGGQTSFGSDAGEDADAEATDGATGDDAAEDASGD